jgi:poly-gamma-glutamate system protein
MELKPVIVSSIGASSHGANDPRFTWIDMEQTLYERGIVPWRAVAVSPGGVVSIPSIFGEEAVYVTQAVVARSGLPLLDEKGEKTLSADVQQRLDLYRNGCGGQPAVFINVGGSLPALGNGPLARALGTGLLPPGRRSKRSDDGVILRMLSAGVPVIHLLDIRKIARYYGLPVDPLPLPAVPDGRVMVHGGYSRTVAWLGLLTLAVLAALIRRKKH